MTAPLVGLPLHEHPRERLMSRGTDALSDRELLATVLKGGTSANNALDVADRLLAEHGSLRAIELLRPEELARCRGVGQATAAAISAAFALGRRSWTSSISSVPIRSAADVASVAQAQLGNALRERVLVLVLNASNRVRRMEVVSEGSVDRSLMPVREILNAVLRHDGRAFAIAHNHPGGDPTPSDADRRATIEIAAGAQAVGLRFLGHVVIGSETWQAIS